MSVADMDYTRQKRVPELLERLMIEVLKQKPDSPYLFLRDFLQQHPEINTNSQNENDIEEVEDPREKELEKLKKKNEEAKVDAVEEEEL